MQRIRALQRFAGSAGRKLDGSGSVYIPIVDGSNRNYSAQPAMEEKADKREDMIEVTVNGRTVSVPKGSNVLQACEAGGVDIPR